MLPGTPRLSAPLFRTPSAVFVLVQSIHSPEKYSKQKPRRRLQPHPCNRIPLAQRYHSGPEIPPEGQRFDQQPCFSFTSSGTNHADKHRLGQTCTRDGSPRRGNCNTCKCGPRLVSIYS